MLLERKNNRDLVLAPRGRVRAYCVFPCGRNQGKCTWLTMPGPDGRLHHWSQRTEFQPNLVLYEWGAIVGNLLLKQGLKFGIGGMYLEFANVASPGDPVPVPPLERDPSMGVAYYDDLATSPDTDYLRVPLVAGTLNSSDATNFPKGNSPTFFAQSTGLVGVHGKPFSDVNNSVVFGAALVAFLDQDDPTQDLVFSRFYFDVSSQQPKLATSQIGIEWPVDLE